MIDTQRARTQKVRNSGNRKVAGKGNEKDRKDKSKKQVEEKGQGRGG